MVFSPLRLPVAIALVMTAVACGNTDEDRPGHSASGGRDGPDAEPTATTTRPLGDAGAPCVEGTRKDCEKELVTGGVVGCFQGEQACIGGEWRDCVRSEDLDAMLLDAGLPVGDGAAGAGGNGGAAGADAGS